MKLYLIIGAVVLALLGWHSYVAKQLKVTKADLATARQSLSDEIAAFDAYRTQRLADDKLSQKVSNDYAKRIADLERDFAARPYRLYCRASKVPTPTGEGAGASGTDATSAGSEPGAGSEDIWPAVREYARDCAVTGERLRALQDFERQRTH